jgi:hypothetical protein
VVVLVPPEEVVVIFHRSYDADTLFNAFPDPNDLRGVDPQEWVDDHRNIMFVAEDGSVGLLCANYPGLFTAHWFFGKETRGRKAIELGKAMLDRGFKEYGMKAVRGYTPMRNKAARWAVRQVGLTSYGVLEFCNHEPCELFLMTKDEFYKDKP